MTGEDWQNGGFGLYLHWPFCQAKCPYCDFNSHVAAEIDQSRWRRTYLSEIARYAAMLPNRVLNTVYFGGGTPSLMAPETVAELISAIRTAWPVANDLEVTLEANPTSVEAGRLRGFAKAGVNRVSMGLQALNDADLKRLGRLHSVDEARHAFALARDTFDRVSFDLIYARQDQTLDDWRAELTQALGFAADHMSLYQLTIEDGTAFGDRAARGLMRGLPDEDRAADMYFLTQDLCDAAGLPAYEVSNHATIGSESRHNLIYWNYGDYIGIGPGAHGRITRNGQKYATETHLSPSAWLQAVETSGHGESHHQPLRGDEQAGEYLMLGLRILNGIDLARYEKLAGYEINYNKIKELVDFNLIEQDGARLKATPEGRAVLNAVIRELMMEPGQ